MSWMAVASIAATVISTSMQKQGADDAAAAARANAQNVATEKDFEAQQLNQQAGQAIAVSQRQAEEQRRQARLVQSRTLAVAAASGAGVSDPTLVKILARTAGEGSYRATTALYGGEERARQLRMQAAGAEYEGAAGIQGGAAKARAYETQGNAALFSGAASLFGKYNAGFGGQAGFGTQTIDWSPRSAGDFVTSNIG